MSYTRQHHPRPTQLHPIYARLKSLEATQDAICAAWLLDPALAPNAAPINESRAWLTDTIALRDEVIALAHSGISLGDF